MGRWHQGCGGDKGALAGRAASVLRGGGRHPQHLATRPADGVGKSTAPRCRGWTAAETEAEGLVPGLSPSRGGHRGARQTTGTRPGPKLEPAARPEGVPGSCQVAFVLCSALHIGATACVGAGVLGRGRCHGSHVGTCSLGVDACARAGNTAGPALPSTLCQGRAGQGSSKQEGWGAAAAPAGLML